VSVAAVHGAVQRLFQPDRGVFVQLQSITQVTARYRRFSMRRCHRWRLYTASTDDVWSVNSSYRNKELELTH